MDKNKVLDILIDLEKKLQDKETSCYTEIGYLRKHKYELEASAMQYKAEAYNNSWLEVSNTIDKIKTL